MQNLTPLWLLKYLPNMLACHVTIVHDCQGPSNTITCCEASSGLSLGESVRVIQRGQADACLTGGAESRLNPLGIFRQQAAGRTARATAADGAGVARPFAPDARGTVLGEGGGILVVEAAETAAARGARVYAEVAGFAATQSFVPDSATQELDADGPEIGDAIEAALASAGVEAGAIDAVVPLGSSIPHVDRAEAAALQRVFGTRAAELPLVTSVPNVGNCCAGQGAIGLALAAQCLAEQHLPARLHTAGAKGVCADAVSATPGGAGARARLQPRPGRAERRRRPAEIGMNRRTVITGMGWVTPLGHDLDTVWGRLVRGESGVDRIDRFDATTFPTTFAAQVRDYDFKQFLDDPELHRHAGANSRFALGAARQAWEQAGLGGAGLAGAGIDPRRIGIYLGAGEGVLNFDHYAQTNLEAWDESTMRLDTVRWAARSRELIDGWGEVEQEPNMPAAHLAREFGARGPSYNCLTACAASTQAIGEAFSIIQRGDADVMISGGTHTMIHVLGVTGFNRLTALSTRNDDITNASRPFHRSREGFVMGEGSGIVILEALEHALARGATPLAEVVGYGSSADAFRITDMHPEGRGPAVAIRQALEQAGLDASALGPDGRPPIHYISAHGTGTKENDSIETRAVKAVFGDHAPKIPISSIKSMTGHLIAAAGSVELITCVMAIRHAMVPPTINLDDPDPDLDLDYVPNEARAVEVETCLSNSFGFGGQNDALIVRKYA